MKIDEALPEIFARSYPVLEPSTKLLLALSLLRFHQIDALPLSIQRGQRTNLAVMGYSCLSNLLDTNPEEYGKYLEQPCKKVAQELATLPSGEELTELLELFRKSKFGFALIRGLDEIGGLASLRDLLAFYGDGLFSTDLTIGEVASPIFKMPGSESLKNALHAMFERRFRRIFVSETGGIVSDRSIIGYIFSSKRLNQIASAPETMLDATLNNVEKLKPQTISSKASIKIGANIIKSRIEECLVCEKGVLTPWDLIVKPFEMDKLRIRN